MLRWAIGLVFFLYTISVQAQSNQPKLTLNDFKQGIFVYENGLYKGGKITRTKKWQVEEYPHLHLKLKFRIDWVADFEYHLTFEQTSDGTTQCMMGKVIKVKVLSIQDDTFNVLVQNEGKFETIKIRMIDDDPKNQEGYSRVMNNFKY